MASGNFNQWTGIGNVGKDPDSGFTQNGKQWCKFNIATSQGFKGETLWMPCTAWGQLAEICNNYLRKGIKVFVQGSLEVNEYTSNDGIKRSNFQVVLSSMQILTPKSQQSPQEQQSPQDIPPDIELETNPF